MIFSNLEVSLSKFCAKIKILNAIFLKYAELLGEG